MLFSNQKIFLDVKDYSKIGQLEASICQFGGVIEKFLSKEITCVVTNRARTEGVSLQRNVSASASTHGQSFRPSANGSRVLSRGQTLLMHSNSRRDMSVCEPVAFAETWGIKIVTLDTIVQAIDRQLQSCSPSSPATKQSTKPHHVIKKTNFLGAFIKVEDTESNFRPFFSQYLTFPYLDLEGDLSTGIFKCAENVRPVATRKNVSTPAAAASARKQKVWSKPGYCECCDTMYDDLSQHLASTDHQRFAENVENFAAVDKLIDQICSSNGIDLSLPADDYCTPDVASKTKSTECAEEMRSSNCSYPSAAAVESAAYRIGCVRENQSSDQHGKPDKVVDTVQNCRASHGISVEEAAKYCRSPLHFSSGVNTCCVNSENHHADDGGDMSQSPVLEVDCNASITLSTSVTVTSLVDSHKTTEAPCNVKSCGMLIGGNPTNSDDMPQFISSDCVVNLLELLSSDNSVDSALHADEAGSVTAMASPHMPAVCTSSSDTICNEMLPYDEPKHCQPTTTASVSAEYNCPLTLMQNDLLDMHRNAGMMEQNSAVGDNFTTKCEPGSNTLMLSGVPILPPTDVAVSKNSLIVNDEMNHDNIRSSCDTNVALVLRSSPSYAPQPVASAVPVYASSGVNNSPTVDDYACLPVHCGLTADSFDLCHKSLTTVYASEHHKQQNFSSAPVHSDILADGSDVHNKLLAAVCASDVAERDRQQNFSSAPVGSDILADCFDLHDTLLTMGYSSDIAEHDKQQNKKCSSSLASYPCLADYAAVSTSVNNNLWLPMTFSPPLCFSEASVNCTDDNLHTPVHSTSHLLESPAAFTTLSVEVSTESASLCCSSPMSVLSYLADVNESLPSSVSCGGSQRDIEGNVMSNKQANASFALETGDSQVNSYPCMTFDSKLECDMTAECTSLHETEDYHKLTSADIETRLIDNVSCCVKPFTNVLDSMMSPFSALLLQSEVNTVSSIVVPESNTSTGPVGLTDADSDSDSDSACTVVYNYDCLVSSVLEPASDSCSSVKDKTEATVNDGEPCVPSANSMWKVVFCAGCRMRLARTEPVLPTPFAQNNTKVESRSSLLGHESHCINKSLHEEDASDSSCTSNVVNNCDSVTIVKHAGDRRACENESETDVDISDSNSNSTWKVISFEDCHMKLARSKAALCAPTASLDSRHCYYAKESCHPGSKLFLPNMGDSVLTC